MKIIGLVIGILLIIPGAFMITDGILAKLGNDVIFFAGTNVAFEVVVGFALIILGASQIDSEKK